MTDAQPWHSLTEAAAMTGLEREAIRSRARRGLIPSRKNNRGELLVQVPADLLTGHDQGITAVATDEATTLRAAMAEVEARERYIMQLELLLVELRHPWWRRLIGGA